MKASTRPRSICPAVSLATLRSSAPTGYWTVGGVSFSAYAYCDHGAGDGVATDTCPTGGNVNCNEASECLMPEAAFEKVSLSV